MVLDKSWIIKKILIQLCLVVLAALLFAGSFPNPLFKNGLPYLAWFALFPALLIIKNNNFPVCVGWGAIFGCLCYALFNYWLSTFHPMAGIFVYFLYAFYMALVFFLFKLADILYPNKAYIIQWTVWISYEYLRTKGFLGYSYGIIGYSQWQFIQLIQIASITGVWGVSALVTFPSFFLANLINREKNGQETNAKKCSCCLRFFSYCSHFKIKKEKWPAIIWAAALIAALIFGFARNKDFSGYPPANITLIQHNTDPWLAARAPTSWQMREMYQKDLAILTRLSDEALAAREDTRLVVWPETAFIPRIYWHTIYRDDQDSWLIVRDFLSYLEKQDVPFLVGNDDGRSEPAKNPNENERHRVDYNAAMLFEKGENTGIYRKCHLVPFTEHFPYKNQFPLIYKTLLKQDTFFWEKGTEKTVFSVSGFKFSSPICFEDTFGYLSRDFTRLGADVLVNITNDAWADSLSAQKQHQSMAVFRAVENSRSMVRAAVSGQTCAIDPRGRIIAEAPAFKEAYLNAAVPISKEVTPYTKYGDYLGVFFVIASISLLIFKTIWGTIKR